MPEHFDRRALVARSSLRMNAPVSDARITALAQLVAARLSPNARVVDLGCGWATLPLAILRAHGTARGYCVDEYEPYVARGRASAVDVADRVEFDVGDAARWQGHADALIAVGTGHLFGALAEARCAALASKLSPGGVLLLGDGIWSQPPSPELLQELGSLPTRNEWVLALAAHGLACESIEEATLSEWDAFESGWRSPFESSTSPELVQFAADRKRDYEEGYRGVLGFLWVVARAPSSNI